MRDRDTEAGFASIYPLSREEIAALPLADAERELEAAILAAPVPEAGEARLPTRPTRRRRRRAYAAAGLVAAAVAILILFLVPRTRTEKAAPLFAASEVQVARTSPLVLLDQPGWRVTHIEVGGGRGEMHFIRPGRSSTHPTERAELRWLSGAAASRLRRRAERSVPYVVYVLPPVLDTRVLQIHAAGPPGRKRFTAIWEDRGRVLLFRSTAPSYSAFERRLGALRRVGPIAWLTALPEELGR